MRPSEVESRLRRALAVPAAATTDYDLNPGSAPPPRGLRPAAVLCAVDLTGAEARVILTKRSAQLRHHPGQIAFPGGKLDAGEDVVAGALREAAEEIGLPTGQAEVLGTFGPHETVTGFSIMATRALLHEPFVAVPQAGEVAEVFGVPLAHLARLDRYRVDGRRWQGYLRRYWVVPYGPYYVWGATARLLRGLAERLEAVR